MKKTLIFVLCLLVCFQIEVFSRGGGGFHSSSFHSSGMRGSSRSFSKSTFRGFGTRSYGIRSGSKNASKIGIGGSKGIRSFSKSSKPKSISRFVGKPFAKSRTIKTSRFARRPVSYTYTRPVRFHNPYLTYYLLSRSHRCDTARVDTNAFPGFGKGKSGGGGASAIFVDSLKKQTSKSTLEITELVPINYLSDYAGIIPDKDELKINSLIRHYKKLTGVEIGILTIPTLGDEIDLEAYTQVLFDKWGVGERGANNGILIVISSEDEILRVQSGYGLEELLPDAICRRIEDQIMIPACKNKQWELATSNAVKDITKRLGDKPIEIMKRELADRKKKAHQELVDNIYTGLEVVAFIALIGCVIFLFKRKRKSY